jgi:hypothetical protein
MSPLAGLAQILWGPPPPTAHAVGYGLSPLRGLGGILLEHFTHHLRSGLSRFGGARYAG